MHGNETTPPDTYQSMLREANIGLYEMQSSDAPYSADSLDSVFGKFEAACRQGRHDHEPTVLESFDILATVAETSRQIALRADDPVYAALFETRRDGYQAIVKQLGGSSLHEVPTNTNDVKMDGAKE